jgi:hypothetical protein
MEGRRLYVKLFLIRVVIKSKYLKPALKNRTLFLILYSSIIKWECNRRFLVPKNAGYLSIKCSLDKPHLRLLYILIIEVKRRKRKSYYL